MKNLRENPLILALDAELKDAKIIIQELKEEIEIFKIGSRLFTQAGPSAVSWVHREKRKVFLDLKFHDVPKTAEESARNAVRLGVWGFTIHCSGGFAMMKAAARAAQEESKKLKIPKPLIFGVTVLTSLSSSDLRQIGVERSSLAQVQRLARLAKAAGLDGVVASGNEISAVRKICGRSFLIAVPGIRPGSKASDDQKRIVTPKSARDLGANFFIVGRPILDSKNRRLSARKFLSEVYRYDRKRN